MSTVGAAAVPAGGRKKLMQVGQTTVKNAATFTAGTALVKSETVNAGNTGTVFDCVGPGVLFMLIITGNTTTNSDITITLTVDGVDEVISTIPIGTNHYYFVMGTATSSYPDFKNPVINFDSDCKLVIDNQGVYPVTIRHMVYES
ncbi:MAG: hypothetical protein JAY74_13470 [Candidatus Thiodiazotropha taylori]|nr:hypothetical protein [Candidatus Thiodiazotropha taylori]